MNLKRLAIRLVPFAAIVAVNTFYILMGWSVRIDL